ncbi:MAG: DsbA family protein [Kangiella sp.]|nr:MAG: DsbA family protein [Kangiella sp.]
MCSWCWGFEPVRKALFGALPSNLDVKILLGGLAPDSDQPMAEPMQLMLQQTWRKIQEAIPDTEFNFEFWKLCQPRRSTYPSNRAVIAARKQGKIFEELMIVRIQQGYYLEAKNPSDKNTLIEFAREIELDVNKFEVDLDSQEVQNELINEIRLCRELGLNSFPSLAMQINGAITPIAIDYLNETNMLKKVEKLLKKN